MSRILAQGFPWAIFYCKIKREVIMRIIADLHLHSKYSRATSKEMNVLGLAKWAGLKGIKLLGTGDFTHPVYFSELKQNLDDLGNGLFVAKGSKNPRFILSAEISSIYSQGNKGRRIHNIVLAPSMEVAEKINKKLGAIGNLYSDGRPILGISAKDLAKIILEIDPKCMIIPAHIWTPWFSLFGSNSGFNTLEECFGEMSQYIYAGETGLSSDPEMNWRFSQLDKITLISNSDSHSLPNLGREANIFEVENEDYDYNYICEIIKAKDPQYFPATIEFYPEEGKYHFDGHRDHQIVLHPQEALKNKNICPVCGKQLTIGVAHRVEELADRQEGYQPQNFPQSIHLVPLQEIIAEAKGIAKTSLRVQEEYLRIINTAGNEFSILLDKSPEELNKNLDEKIAQGIINVRNNQVKKIPGYDGVYGVIKVLNKTAEPGGEVIDGKNKNGKQQTSLF